MIDKAPLRWLTFCEVRPFPRDTNEIIQSVLDQLNNVPHDPFTTGLAITEQLDFLDDAGILVVHAEDEARDLLEVRLTDEIL